MRNVDGRRWRIELVPVLATVLAIIGPPLLRPHLIAEWRHHPGAFWWWYMVIFYINWLQDLAYGMGWLVHRPSKQPLRKAALDSIRHNEAFYYREERSFGGRLSFRYAALICLGVSYGLIWHDWIASLLVIPALIVTNSTRTVFVVTNDYISARIGFFPNIPKLIRQATIRMQEIESCDECLYRSMEEGERRKVRVFDGRFFLGKGVGSCLRIKTLDGKIFLLGMNNPQEIAVTIQMFLAARGATEELLCRTVKDVLTSRSKPEAKR